MTLKRRSSTLSLRVFIEPARYPAAPPTWEIHNDAVGSDDTLGNDNTALYDEQLTALERAVNQDIEQLVRREDETSYEWILAHQLSEIATKWEKQLIESESSN